MSIVWMTYMPGRYPTCQVRAEDETIEICLYDGGGYGTCITLDRKHARLLAKRINQCLDETRVGAEHDRRRA